jgi:hypothetical protein
MTIQARSSVRGGEWRKAGLVRTVVCVCVLGCSLSEHPSAPAYPQSKPPVEANERFRFQVTDFENDLPISEAAVSLVYWRRKSTTQEKKEMEVKTDKNGLAGFPRVEADQLAVSVTVKGYRSCWRWIQPVAKAEPTRIRLVKWAAKNK